MNIDKYNNTRKLGVETILVEAQEALCTYNPIASICDDKYENLMLVSSSLTAIIQSKRQDHKATDYSHLLFEGDSA